MLLALALACAPRRPTADLPMATPPEAERRPHVWTEHGVERPDPYAWMRDRDDPAVQAYVAAENAWTDARTAHLAPLRRALFDEMVGRMQETDASVPVADDGWLTYTRTEQGRPYPIHCRRRDEPGAPEQVLLDENALAAGHDYFALGDFVESASHRMLAYSTDTTGGEVLDVRFIDLDSGTTLPDRIGGAYYSGAWAADDSTWFYVTVDETWRPWQVWRHRLGTPQSADALVYQEDDERFEVTVSPSRTDAFVVVDAQSFTTSEVRVLPADEPEGVLRTLVPRRAGVLAHAYDGGDRWFVVTDEDAVEFRIREAPLEGGDPATWTDLVPYEGDAQVLSVVPFADWLVVSERADATARLSVIDRKTRARTSIDPPGEAGTTWPIDNDDYDARFVRYSFSSMVAPESVWDHDLATAGRALRKEQPVLGGFDRSRYRTERLWARAPDGAEVPVTVAYRADRPRDRSAPLWLYGYGAYGISWDPEFSSNDLSLLDRGFAVAVAHVRGGGEMGRRWYLDGKLERKANTFRDFVAAAEMLVAEGWTSPERLVIESVSAGGLLVGDVINERPELFAVAIAEVPFVDAVTTMLDATIPLTANEWEEWGDPRDRRMFDVMRSYSPYDNVRDQAYPHLLVTSGMNDPRVGYWEPTKWTARLRDHQQGPGLILLRTHMGAGHSGESGRYGMIEDRAFVVAFALDRLGMAAGPT